ncbi:MAG: Hsp33 family molecular chaperone [Parvibaculaceae bacterium]|nr:Hsp33 family molecular chaperone [Parvibaculaceae bacterium]
MAAGKLVFEEASAGRDDMVQSFQVGGIGVSGGVRGRIVRLGPLVHHVLTRHAYPEPVSRLLAEAMALTSMLGAALKFEGRFTLQAQSDGPVSMLVVDYETPGTMRGYAHLDSARYEALAGNGAITAASLLGTGQLAMTVDQGEDMDTYQGIVPLGEGGFLQAAHEYFERSEQIATRIRLAAGPLYQRNVDGHGETAWRAGAIMIQHIAREGGITGYRAEGDERPFTDADEDWNRSVLLLDTVKDHELLDPALSSERLLFQLFHEDGVRVFEPVPVAFGCHCSRERLEDVLSTFGDDDIAHMIVDGVISATCDFCSTVYNFTPEELHRPDAADVSSAGSRASEERSS